MRIGVLGTGSVGQTIATKLVSLGHEVMMGSRTADNENAAAWVAANEAGTSRGTFGDAAAFGELVFNCTAGGGALEALGSIRAEHLAGKTVVDVTNPLERGEGGISLFVSNTDSLGERIQRALPDAKVVKTLNTVNHEVMADPSKVPGEHDVFVCGDDEAAKRQVVELLETFGWPRENILDLGDITAARGAEMYLALWLRLWGVTGGPHFNIKVVR